jgi:hypothetical protein
MKFDKYGRTARLVPALFTIVFPLLIFNHFFVNKQISKIIENFNKVEFLGDITMSVVLMFFTTQFARVIGKNLFERRIYKDELEMPTTQFLTYSNTEYSDDYKMKFAKKVKKDFGIVLSTKEEEKKDKQGTYKRKIIETFSHIRKRINNNSFVLQHNIEYGAMRNALGGSVVGVLISVLNIAFFYFVTYNLTAVALSMFLFVVYLFMLIFSSSILKSYGRNYAKIIIREYMGEQLNKDLVKEKE